MLIAKKKMFDFRITKKKFNGAEQKFFQKYWRHSIFFLFIPIISWEEDITEVNEDYDKSPAVKTTYAPRVPINDEDLIMKGEVERNFE